MDLSIYYDFSISLFDDAQKNINRNNMHKKYINSLVFPKFSKNILHEYYQNISRMIGLCMGFNTSYLFEKLSSEDKKTILDFYKIESLNDETMCKHTMEIYNDITKNINNIPILSKHKLSQVYNESICKHMHPLLHNFIFPDTLIDRHVAVVNQIKLLEKTMLISKNKLSEDVSIEIYLSNCISNYFFIIKSNNINQLYNIPVNDNITALLAMLKNDDQEFIKNLLTVKIGNIFENIKRDYPYNKQLYDHMDDIMTFTEIIDIIDTNWTESLKKIKLIILNIIKILWLTD